MRKFVIYLTLASLPFFSPYVTADAFNNFEAETSAIWSPDKKDPDTSQDAKIATSMLAWGIGLAVAIAIVFGLLKSYNNTSSSTSGTT